MKTEEEQEGKTVQGWKDCQNGDLVRGYVRMVDEKIGVFVDLAPSLSGLLLFKKKSF